jgi:hypothetical protein
LDGFALSLTDKFQTIGKPGTAESVQEGETGEKQWWEVQVERFVGRWKRQYLALFQGNRYLTKGSIQTSRRTTRRPQTQTQTTIVVHSSTPPTPSVAPPFTHAPLHRTASSTPQNLAFQPHPSNMNTDSGEDRDAWEAAQSILKAINLGGLLKLPDESKSPESAVHADHLDSSIGPDLADGSGSKAAEGRAELQAQLALLAAQLAEIAQGDTVSVAERQGKGGRGADEIDMEG